MKQRSQRGSAMLEFAFAGITIMFAVISIVQMAIVMWNYHTMQYAVKHAGRYVAIHGASYINAGNMARQIQDAASVLAANAIGISPKRINVTWTAGSTSVTCRLDACLTNTTVWPPIGSNSTGADIQITAHYVVKSGLAMFVPGPGGVRFSNSYDVPGYTHQFILF